MQTPSSPYQIIATLGPATRQPQDWQALLAAGATGFRLNTSHLSLPELDEWLAHLADFRLRHPGARQDGAWQVTLDLQGSKWRLGRLPVQDLSPGQQVELILAAETAQPATLPVPNADFFLAAAQSNGEVVLNDARVRLQLTGAPGGERLAAVVTQGGALAPAKGVTFSQSGYRQEKLSEKDRAILRTTAGLGFVRYAVSYVRDAGEMRTYIEHAAPDTAWIAKIERRPAVQDAPALAALSAELWICRGDLGAELGLPGMAAATAALIAQARALPSPLLLAGQVFEHLTAHPTPTRAEVCNLHDTLAAGCAGVVLSDETAIGRHPLEAVRAAAMFTPDLQSS